MAPRGLCGALLALLLDTAVRSGGSLAAGCPAGAGNCTSADAGAEIMRTSAMLQSKLQQGKESEAKNIEVEEQEAMGELGVPVALEQELVDLQQANDAYRSVSDHDDSMPGWLRLDNAFLGYSVQGHNLLKMFDKNPGTAGGARTLIIDLGQEYKLTKQVIQWQICKCARKSAMKLLHSRDGKNWENYVTIEEFYVNGDSKTQEYQFDITARYLAVNPANSPKKWAGIWEFSVWGMPSPRAPSIYGWYHSYKAGWGGLSGTEMIHLEAYKGRLFGGTGYWMNPGGGRAAEIVRLDCPMCDWTVETQVNQYAGRAETLNGVTWTTDHKGNKLATPDSRLIAGFYLNWQGEGRCMMIVRDDDTKIWSTGVYWAKRPWKGNYFSARALALFQDPITKTDMLFYTTGMDGVIAGVYYPAAMTKVAFPKKTETGKVETRPLALAVMDGRIYFTASSYVMRRNNGPNPSWSKVFDMADHDKEQTIDEAVGGMRGMSTISNPASPTGHSLLFSWAPNENSAGCMIRLDPDGDGFKWEQEACVRDIERRHLGKNVDNQNALTTFVIADYNFALEVDPTTQLIGFQVLLYSYTAFEFPVDPGQLKISASGKRLGFKAAGGYLIRRGPTANQYESREPGGPRHDPMDVFPQQTAVRCYAKSPFNDGAVYFGGYDCNHFNSFNTAWVQRGEESAAWKEPVKCQKELGCGHVPGKNFEPLGCHWWPDGAEFNGKAIAGWRDKQPVMCQAVLDWINAKAGNELQRACVTAQDWPAINKCSELHCDFCSGIPGVFQGHKTAGYDASGNEYKCTDAKDYMKTPTHGLTCRNAQQWWGSACCG